MGNLDALDQAVDNSAFEKHPIAEFNTVGDSVAGELVEVKLFGFDAAVTDGPALKNKFNGRWEQKVLLNIQTEAGIRSVWARTGFVNEDGTKASDYNKGVSYIWTSIGKGLQEAGLKMRPGIKIAIVHTEAKPTDKGNDAKLFKTTCKTGAPQPAASSSAPDPSSLI